MKTRTVEARTGSAPRELSGDFVVVGAGFAGLMAAYELLRAGKEAAVNVTVLEARDRVGGRVHSLAGDLVPGRIIEAGAELIGADHPHWLELARTFGLGLSLITQGENDSQLGLAQPLRLGGHTYTPSEQSQLEAVVATVYDHLADMAASIPPDHPWDAPDAEALDAMSVEDWLQHAVIGVSEDAKNIIRFELENDQTVPTGKMSLLGLLALIQGGGGAAFWDTVEVYRCQGGNQALALALATAIVQQGGKMLLNTPVARIAAATAGKASVVCANGDNHQADYVIVAVPPPALKRLGITDGVATLQVGPAHKYLTQVRSRFWLTEGKSPGASSDEFGQSWEGTDNQMDLVGTPDQRELSVFAGGRYAALGATDIEQGLTGIYPGYPAAKVTAHLVDWAVEPWTWCGYSCPGPGQVTTVLKDANAAHRTTRLIFAGEHMSPAFFGFMEGALDSGVRAVDLLRSS
jgi:monoamine oxidase